MPAAMLDTLRCAQSLKEAGFTQQQADGTARVLGDALAGVANKGGPGRHQEVSRGIHR